MIYPILLALQVTPTPKLPPANPLPPPTVVSAEAAVIASIDRVFAALEAGDAAALLKNVYPDGRVTAVGTRADGTRMMRSQSFGEYAERVKPDKPFRERITDPAIDIDEDIAMVWAPFTVVVDGKVSNCGTDHFDLIRENGAWKVMNITFSTRTTDCPPQ